MDLLQGHLGHEIQIAEMESAYYSMIANAMKVVSQDQYRSNMCSFNEYIAQMKVELCYDEPDRNKITLIFVEMAMAINVFNQDVMLTKGSLNWLFAEVHKGNINLVSSLILYCDDDLVLQ